MPHEKHDSKPAQQARSEGRDKQGATASKEAKLDALRNAYPEELDVQGEKLRGDARRKGASPQETERAANKPPPRPRHG